MSFVLNWIGMKWFCIEVKRRWRRRRSECCVGLWRGKWKNYQIKFCVVPRKFSSWNVFCSLLIGGTYQMWLWAFHPSTPSTPSTHSPYNAVQLRYHCCMVLDMDMAAMYHESWGTVNIRSNSRTKNQADLACACKSDILQITNWFRNANTNCIHNHITTISVWCPFVWQG